MKSYEEILNLVKYDIDVINAELTKKIHIREPIFSAINSFLSLPAKRIRPLLAILYLRANNFLVTEKHYKLLTAIEIVHNASLIHDDVIDDAELRRTKKTFNTTFNPKLAVIVGDYLLSVALDYVRESEDSQILEKFTDTLAAMCKGEFSQYFSVNQIPSLEEYICKTECKTARLFMTALESVMIASDADPRDAVEFARNFGIAFQIKDDLNNVLTTQSDIKSGVYTAPVILSGKVEEPAIEKTRCLLNNYLELASGKLQYVEENRYKRALIELMEIYGQ